MSKNKGMPKILWLLVPLAIAKVLHVKKHKMAHKRHGHHCGKGWHHKCHGRKEAAPDGGELI